MREDYDLRLSDFKLVKGFKQYVERTQDLSDPETVGYVMNRSILLAGYNSVSFVTAAATVGFSLANIVQFTKLILE